MSDVLQEEIMCEHCNETFITPNFLQSHLSHVHFICLLCNDKPQHDSQLDLVIHEWLTHPEVFIPNK